MSNFDNIIQEINTNLPDNNARRITAKKLRDTLIDFVDVSDDEVTNVKNSVNTINTTLNGGGSSVIRVTTDLVVNWAGTGAVRTKSYGDDKPMGSINTSQTECKYTDYVDISNYANKNTVLTYTNCVHTASQDVIGIGLCFYDSNRDAISGVPFKGGASAIGYETNTINVPTNAAYIRFTCLNQYTDIFTASVTYDSVVPGQGGLIERVGNNETDIATLKDDVDDINNTLNGSGSSVIRVTTNLSVDFIGTGAIRSKSYGDDKPMGSINTSQTNCQYTDYVDISNYANKNTVLTYINCTYNVSQSSIGLGMCFYDSNREAISAVPFKGDASAIGYETNTINVPTNAAYIRFTCLNQYTDIFTASVTYDRTESSDGLVGKVDEIENDVDSLKVDVDSLKGGIGIKIIENKSIISTTGVMVNNTNYNSTDYIKINNYEKFSIPIFPITVPNQIGLAFYDRNKAFIQGIHFPYLTPSGYTFERYIAPGNAEYVRFTIAKNTTPYLNIESHFSIGPNYNMYKSFNTTQTKGQFKIYMNFNNGVMLGTCGQDKNSTNDDVLLYRSTDWGITWTYLGNATRYSSLQLQEGLYYGAHDNNGTAIIGSGDLNDHYLLKVTNYGASFPSDYTKILTASDINSLVGVTTNGIENVIYLGNNTYRAFCNSMGGFSGSNAVIESTDAGATWHTITSSNPLLASLRTIYKDSNGTLWGAGMHPSSYQGVWKSTDNGLNWTRKSNFLSFQSIIEYNGSLFSGAMASNTNESYIYKSSDGGETWTQVLATNIFTPIYHRTFIPYKNALLAVFCQGEGSTAMQTVTYISYDNGDNWNVIERTGCFNGGYEDCDIILGDTYYINTHSGLYIIN